jgi:hypothetical protein
MKRHMRLVAAALAAAAVGLTAGTTVAAAPSGLAACAQVPARYDGSPLAMFFTSSCIQGQTQGPVRIARNFHFGTTAPAGVARLWASWTLNANKKSASLWARIQQVGVTNYKTALYSGMLAGFRARGRP